MKIEKITNNFYVYTTWKDFNGSPFSSNSMFVITNEGVVMIDCPWDTSQLNPLLDSIYKISNQKVVFCIATHFHEDRTGCFDLLKAKGIPCWSSFETQKLCEKENFNIADNIFYADTTFRFGNVVFETYYPGKGHAPDNIVIWFPAQKLLYGGCFVKSPESPNLGNLSDADPVAWKLSLNKVIRKFPDPQYVITGHQNWHSTSSLNHTKKLLKKY